MESTDLKNIIVVPLIDKHGNKRTNFEEIIKSLSRSSNSTIISEDKNVIIIKLNSVNETVESIVPKIKFVALNSQEKRDGLLSRMFHQTQKNFTDEDNEKLVDISGFLVKV